MRVNIKVNDFEYEEFYYNSYSYSSFNIAIASDMFHELCDCDFIYGFSTSLIIKNKETLFRTYSIEYVNKLNLKYYI
jgi:hypothetical protein